MDERRKFFRFGMAVNTKCGVMSRLEPLITTRTENVSAGGLCLPIKKKINKRSIIDIEINLPNDFVPIFAVGEIVWLKKDKKKDTFKAGIEFKAIDDYDRNRILTFASSQKSSS